MNSYQQLLVPSPLDKPPAHTWTDKLASLPSWHYVLTLLLVGILLLPVGTVLTSLVMEDNGTLSHLFDTVLWRYISNALIMLVGVCAVTFAMGTIPAWLVTMYHFPGINVLRWALILPLAMPAYVLAMVYGHLLEPAGPMQSWFREMTGLGYKDYYFPDIRSLFGTIIMLSLALYPYVYILSRNAFAQHSRQLLDSARMLGTNDVTLFTKIALPIARPALVVALALVGMETLADFGTVSFYGVESFTTGIYRTWYGMGDIIGAAKLSAMLLLLVAGILWVERKSRNHARYHNTTALYHPLPEKELPRYQGWVLFAMCCFPVVAGFLIPIGTLLYWTVEASANWGDKFTWTALKNAIIMGVSVVIVALSIATFFSLVMRRNSHDHKLNGAIRLSALGYAVPGSVIAVGILIPMLTFDKWLANTVSDLLDVQIGLLITGSIAGVVLACTVRFMAVALGSVESALQTVTKMMDDAACVLGACKSSIACRIHLPMIKGGLLMAAIMLFVDTIKELPATIMLRPFNFDTLAIRTYELAMDEQLFAAAVPALMMITISLAPVLLLAFQINTRPGNQHKSGGLCH